MLTAGGQTHAADVPVPGDPKGPTKLTVERLAEILLKTGLNPTAVYGCRVEFTATVLSINKGVDDGTVPTVRIAGWPGEKDLYQTVFVHNTLPDQHGKVGDRVRIDGLITEHGYGTLFLWCYHWRKLEN